MEQSEQRSQEMQPGELEMETLLRLQFRLILIHSEKKENLQVHILYMVYEEGW